MKLKAIDHFMTSETGMVQRGEEFSVIAARGKELIAGGHAEAIAKVAPDEPDETDDEATAAQQAKRGRPASNKMAPKAENKAAPDTANKIAPLGSNVTTTTAAMPGSLPAGDTGK